MNPALSVIFFTTLSGAGYGLLAWLGLSLAALDLRGDAVFALAPAYKAMLVVGVLLSTIGLLCSLGHLGKPQRAWRAFSQWRTSWLSREGVLSMLTLAPAIATGLSLWVAPHGAAATTWAAAGGIALALCALGTVVCTAMIYASLRPIPAWRHPLVVPVYVVFALLTGLALKFVLQLATLGTHAPGDMIVTLALVALLACVMKAAYWHEIDRNPGLPSRGAALGLPAREAAVFERPSTQGNYITHEMGFAIARTHAHALRASVYALLLGGIAGAWAIALAGLPSTFALSFAAAALLAAALVERWLFFAQARHVVMRYY